ncbi:unnamed protein product [Mytilus edulis]|uniref:C2H2-type domain-containing protein n=1 Tax=Mytilus edulis TaxID=6550 RepID=A0A8S3Q7Z2_MYTED|nr:unnamed protein product [Mytilus edulis]
MAIQIFADGDFNDENLENRIAFCYTPTTMQCPIDGCNAGRFGSRAKYQRHWDEKHLYLTINYSCPERLCKSVCRRKTDMKQHLKKVHDIENVLKLETQLTSCKKEVRENKGFVDPGVFIFRGRTKLATTTTSTTSLTNTVTTMEYKNRSQPETENAYSGHPANNHSGCTSTIPSNENLTTEQNNQSGCKTTSSETQTSITDLPPLVLPLIPETRPEVESLLRWLCNSMDAIGRLRESAKRLRDVHKYVMNSGIRRSSIAKYQTLFSPGIYDEFICSSQ